MINNISYFLKRPEKGWDPISKSYAQQYAQYEYAHIDKNRIKEIIRFTGGLEGKAVLDLGAGPGQYSLEFAECGAVVTWHDISRNYQEIARQKAREHNVMLNFRLGYMEEADGEYDLVFSRICWCYCINDFKFAKLIYHLVAKGGYGYLIINNEDFYKKATEQSIIKRIKLSIQFWLNELLDFKIGHPHPSRNKIAKVFAGYNFHKFEISHESTSTIVKFRK